MYMNLKEKKHVTPDFLVFVLGVTLHRDVTYVFDRQQVDTHHPLRAAEP